MNLLRWLTPGIGVKRWLLVVFLGLLLLAVSWTMQSPAGTLKNAARALPLNARLNMGSCGG